MFFARSIFARTLIKFANSCEAFVNRSGFRNFALSLMGAFG